MNDGPSCANPVFPKATTCPQCGHPFKKPTSGCAWFVLIGGIILIISMFMSEGYDPADEAVIRSWQFVRAGLKSPCTADFPYSGDHQLYTLEGKDNAWEVRGYVDSQNSFGAMIRSNFACQLEYTAEGNWILLDLKIE